MSARRTQGLDSLVLHLTCKSTSAMFERRSIPLTRRISLGLVLMAVLVRALIPSGFMPSAEHPFTLQLCPDGLPDQLLSSNGMHGMHSDLAGHHHNSLQTEHCLFGVAAFTGAAPHVAQVTAAFETVRTVERTSETIARPFQRLRLQQPRAPPSFV
jgi:hypothetical protein